MQKSKQKCEQLDMHVGLKAGSIWRKLLIVICSIFLFYKILLEATGSTRSCSQKSPSALTGYWGTHVEVSASFCVRMYVQYNAKSSVCNFRS